MSAPTPRIRVTIAQIVRHTIELDTEDPDFAIECAFDRYGRQVLDYTPPRPWAVSYGEATLDECTELAASPCKGGGAS